MTEFRYESPLASRYASREMSHLFSSQSRGLIWRRLWIALAKAEQKLGLEISDEQIRELEATRDQLDLDAVAEYERSLRHDVMAHIHAWGDLCPNARGILHLGATSCTITDNGDLIQFREALEMIQSKLVGVIRQLAEFSEQYAAQPCLGFTHYQPAQPTTLGKRATLWAYDLLLDLEAVSREINHLPFFGIKGTTGTQASFLNLFDGDHGKVKKLEQLMAKECGFTRIQPVSGQTYSRKIDSTLVNLLSGIASSAHKFATDLRLLSNLKQVEEPFEAKQIGSSAMPYKRNPMRSERICAISRFVISLAQNPAYTHATQWFERTLDDSANRRLVISEAFLATDGILNLLLNVTKGLIVYPKMIEKQLREELPFMATENLLMEAVKRGGDRQELHEKIRQHAFEASRLIKQEGQENTLLERIAQDEAFGLTKTEIQERLDLDAYVGRAPEQVREFIDDVVKPALSPHHEAHTPEAVLSV